MGKLAERRGRKASGLTDSFPKTAGLPRGRDHTAATVSPHKKTAKLPCTSATRMSALSSPPKCIRHTDSASTAGRRCSGGDMGRGRNVEDNTSKVYVEPDSSQPPLVSQNAGSGTQLFVINLCASIAPVSTTGRNIPGLENYKLYQVARVEDGRTRHRLRLGFFTNEAHAERVLTVVRQQYPTAFTTSLGDEDRRFTRGYVPERAPAPAARPTVAVVNTPARCPGRCCSDSRSESRTCRSCCEGCSCRCDPSARPCCDQSAGRCREACASASEAGRVEAESTREGAAGRRQGSCRRSRRDDLGAGRGDQGRRDLGIAAEDQGAHRSGRPRRDELDRQRLLRRPTPAREPLAVGLLSGKFAALDTSRLKISKPATQRSCSCTRRRASPPLRPRPRPCRRNWTPQPAFACLR